MLSQFIQNAVSSSDVAAIIISIALMLFLAFLMTRITKKLKLPNVTAYIITGILIGPYCLNLIPQNVIQGMAFLPDIALAFIAFSTGEFFKLSTLKKNGIKVLVITLLESLMATFVVFIGTYYILKIDLAFSIVLAALASATAPASTVMTIRQTGAHGDFVDTLLQVVALDDAVGLIAYSVAISLALAVNHYSSSFNLFNIIKPILMNIGALILGGLFGFILKLLIPPTRSKDNKLVISISVIFAFCGICAIFDISPLLGCMGMGTVYINVTNDENLFKQLNYFTPPILLLFFVRSGLSFKLDALVNTTSSVGNTPLIVIGIMYFFMRILGKYSGAFLGCKLAKKKKEVSNYLGLALIPQAGVAIGLAALGARTLGGQLGINLETVILSSSVLYELVGPGCAKLSLYLSKSYSSQIEDIVPEEKLIEDTSTNAVELLIQRIQIIQNELQKEETSEEEKAFQQAADEYDAYYNFRRRNRV